MGNSGKPRFHELEHESKMRLLKTHSHTSERIGYAADKRKKKTRRKAIEGTHKRYDKGIQAKNVPRTASMAGARREGDKDMKREGDTTYSPARGGEVSN
jgi:hypothetical protein